MLNPSFFTSVINSYLPEPHASLLNGILFGIPVRGTKYFYQELKSVGLLHLVVLSGMNITLLGAIIASITRSCSKILSITASIAGIFAFIFFVGPAPPIIRAGIMGILALLAIVFGKKNIALYSLFMSFVFICIFWPQWVNTLSLRLSYGATLGLIMFDKPGLNTTKFTSIRREFKTSIAAQVFTAPLIFIHFKQVSLIAPFANVLVAFIIGPLMVFGFITAILGKISYALGLIPSYICYAFLEYIICVVSVLSKVPYASFQW